MWNSEGSRSKGGLWKTMTGLCEKETGYMANKHLYLKMHKRGNVQKQNFLDGWETIVL